MIPVVPRAGTWIETKIGMLDLQRKRVVPRAGTWIETTHNKPHHSCRMVVPRAGTWIETYIRLSPFR